MAAPIPIKPTTPGQRGMIVADRSMVSKEGPEKSLLTKKSKIDGRNNHGRITVRHRGGAHKRRYRLIDFKRKDKDGIKAKVSRIEYDPNRTSFIALLVYADGEKRYILAPEGMKKDDVVMAGPEANFRVGSSMKLSDMPLGSVIHCVELKPGKGAQLARAAGTSAQYIAKEGKYATLRLRSGEMRKVQLECRATLGSLSNAQNNLISLGKAGATRHRGVRPTVRGVAMNPIDHPHGGGEGKTSGGRHPVSPWGQKTKGYRTRKNQFTDKWIVRKRYVKK